MHIFYRGDPVRDTVIFLTEEYLCEGGPDKEKFFQIVLAWLNDELANDNIVIQGTAD